MKVTRPAINTQVLTSGDAQPRGAPDSLIAALLGAQVPERILSSVMAAEAVALRGTPHEERRKAILFERLSRPKNERTPHGKIATRFGVKPSLVASDQGQLVARIRTRVVNALEKEFPPPAELLRTPEGDELNLLGLRMSESWHRYPLNRERWNPHIGTAIASVRQRLALKEAASFWMPGGEVEGSPKDQLWLLEHLWLAANPVGSDDVQKHGGWLQACALEQWISDEVAAAAASAASQLNP